MASPLRVLILGGTIEASTLARLISGDARFDATLSLAGRTSAPRPQPVATRIGGFGGAQGLARYIADNAVAAVVDATHPYADQISANALTACERAAVPLASIARPPWRAEPGDRWQSVANADEAATALGATPRRVFLSLGRQDLHAFAPAPQHFYIARTVDAPQQKTLPPSIRILQARGPFARTDEIRLLRDEKIDVVVSKNSGGSATYAKIEAARELCLPVIMIDRPRKATGEIMHSAEDAFAWLEGRVHDTRPSPRGV